MGLDIYMYMYCKFGNFRESYFREISHMRSFVKIKPSRIGDITLSFTDIGKSCPVRDFYIANVSFNITGSASLKQTEMQFLIRK